LPGRIPGHLPPSRRSNTAPSEGVQSVLRLLGVGAPLGVGSNPHSRGLTGLGRFPCAQKLVRRPGSPCVRVSVRTWAPFPSIRAATTSSPQALVEEEAAHIEAHQHLRGDGDLGRLWPEQPRTASRSTSPWRRWRAGCRRAWGPSGGSGSAFGRGRAGKMRAIVEVRLRFTGPADGRVHHSDSRRIPVRAYWRAGPSSTPRSKAS
jgi:hypothetical protein